MQTASTLPVMPMRHAVVFPGIPTPLGVSRPLSQKAIEAARRGRGFLFAVTQKVPVIEPTGDELFLVGVVVRLLEVKEGQGDWEVLLHGVTRARATAYSSEDGLISAIIEPIADEVPEDANEPGFVATLAEIRERVLELGQLRGVAREVLGEVTSALTEPGTLADFVASYVEAPTAAKQSLLETTNVAARVGDVLELLVRQIRVEKTRDEIRTRAHGELSTRQREMFLREQLRVIHEELGDEEQDDTDELFRRLEGLALPPRVREEVQRESRRLRRAHMETGEAQVIRTYLEWIVELPWAQRSEDRLEIAEAARILDEDHHGLAQVKERVLEFLAVRALKAGNEAAARTSLSGALPQAGALVGGEVGAGNTSSVEKTSLAIARGPILLFVGQPGVGKTSVARSVARALGRSYVRIALGGVNDESDIRGHRRTYVGAMPGRIIDGLKHAGTKNPVFVLDEIDKLGSSWHGSPTHALLEVLDPAQNDSFTDHYLNVPFDLREVLFIATANSTEGIPAPLLDRMELVQFDGYTESDKIAIGRKFLVPRHFEEAGLGERALPFDDDALAAIIRERTREGGVRQLEREIASLMRKLARKLTAGTGLPERIRAEEVRALLGRARHRLERALDRDEVGTATGMYFTPVGGDIMFVEASVRAIGGAARVVVHHALDAGHVDLVLTGNLGDVMKESARAAITVAMRRAPSLEILPHLRGPLEAHVHVPAGSVPKDGPSAGLAIVVALVSAMCGRPVRREVAITGEITLSGRVLPVGGLEEKLLGAVRAGIRAIVLPAENVPDLERVPQAVLERLRIHPVDYVEEALTLALGVGRGDGTNAGRPRRPGSSAATDRPA